MKLDARNSLEGSMILSEFFIGRNVLYFKIVFYHMRTWGVSVLRARKSCWNLELSPVLVTMSHPRKFDISCSTHFYPYICL